MGEYMNWFINNTRENDDGQNSVWNHNNENRDNNNANFNNLFIGLHKFRSSWVKEKRGR